MFETLLWIMVGFLALSVIYVEMSRILHRAFFRPTYDLETLSKDSYLLNGELPYKVLYTDRHHRQLPLFTSAESGECRAVAWKVRSQMPPESSLEITRNGVRIDKWTKGEDGIVVRE